MAEKEGLMSKEMSTPYLILLSVIIVFIDA